jgi:hypothetical protein
MATTTPNFGWPVPTSTDLVKDGATAIEGLGDAIDASLLDLKGGTTGQVLKKNTNTDMDFVWSSDAAGMTNPMTTTGDTIYSSSGSTPARLGIGSTGQVLTVASGVPSWATPSGATIDTFGVNKTSSQSITTSVATKITFNNEQWDTGNNFASSTFTATETGYWQFSTSLRMYQTGANTQYIEVRKNGSWLYTLGAAGNSTDNYNGGAFIVSLATNDTVELYAYMEGTSAVVNGSTTIQAIFQGHKIK